MLTHLSIGYQEMQFKVPVEKMETIVQKEKEKNKIDQKKVLDTIHEGIRKLVIKYPDWNKT